jgi:hypothetical protein
MKIVLQLLVEVCHSRNIYFKQILWYLLMYWMQTLGNEEIKKDSKTFGLNMSAELCNYYLKEVFRKNK